MLSFAGYIDRRPLWCYYNASYYHSSTITEIQLMATTYAASPVLDDELEGSYNPGASAADDDSSREAGSIGDPVQLYLDEIGGRRLLKAAEEATLARAYRNDASS